VETYADPDEAVAKILALLGHPERRAAIAAAGQARTLREHTYQKRMQELLGILNGYLRRTGDAA